jgi:polar amino acid transport system substrate-binding protein
MRLLIVAALSLAQAATAADLPALKSRTALRVIAAADEQPETFSFKRDGEPGFEREMLESFARLQGVKLEAVPAKSYADRIPMLLAGEGDIIVAIFDTEERRKLVDFTAEVMPTHNVAVTLDPNPAVANLDQLRSQRVGVVKGTASVEDTLAAGVPPSRLVKFDDGDRAIEALRSGTITATVRPISEFALSAKRVKGLHAGIVVGPSGRVAWAVRKEDASLRAALDEYLSNARRAASWNRLLVKYFGDQALDVLGRKPTSPEAVSAHR